MPGWIDSVAAMAAVVLYAGVGLVRFIHGDHHVRIRIIYLSYHSYNIHLR